MGLVKKYGGWTGSVGGRWDPCETGGFALCWHPDETDPVAGEKTGITIRAFERPEP